MGAVRSLINAASNRRSVEIPIFFQNGRGIFCLFCVY